MHLLAYWRLDNYLRDLDEGAGFNFNSKQARLHSAIEPGETLWLFTVVRNPPRYYLAAKLTVRSKTVNRPGYKYGDYRVWGDLTRSRYFRLRPDVSGDEAFDLLRGLPLTSGSLSEFNRSNLPQGCQTIRGVSEDGHRLLAAFADRLETETRAVQVADEYELEQGLVAGDADLADVLDRDHRGPSDDRRKLLLASAPRDRKLVQDLYQLYAGRCQLCGFDSPLVYGTASAEGHHVVYLSRGGDDVLDNLVLLCPNHHTVVHHTDATFDYRALRFCFPNGRVEPLCLNTHLRPHTGQPLPAIVEPAAPAVPLDDLIRAVQSELTPDLLTGEYAATRTDADHPHKGHCYVASEAVYHLAGGAASGFGPARCSLPEGGTHWWLVGPAGRIIDPTAEQFPTPPPYDRGTRTPFRTRHPSARAARLIERVRTRLSSSARLTDGE